MVVIQFDMKLKSGTSEMITQFTNFKLNQICHVTNEYCCKDALLK